ncbi:MAG: hypothetical protein JW987_13455 [Anaerolineaceae bacterium]|nr:hypothetical protein [Anaerolineaceae bacterium]
MADYTQWALPLFPDKSPEDKPNEKKDNRSGTFVDNMKLPVHRWFRYSAGFSAEWVENLLYDNKENGSSTLLDPFVGSGTTLLGADACRLKSIGIEAHPFVARITKAKLNWDQSIDNFSERARKVLDNAIKLEHHLSIYPELIVRCFSTEILEQLSKIKTSWIEQDDGTPISELIWLAITSILRQTSSAGTAQWQYILPNRTKKVTHNPFEAYKYQVDLMLADMYSYQKKYKNSLSEVVLGDARNCKVVLSESIDIVITSPPYANNYDYADATRFEMSFWGDVKSWGDLHETVRQNLIVSSSQHASKEKLNLEEILSRDELQPIRPELTDVCTKLAVERNSHGGKKHYHTMIAAYFSDMAKSWIELRRMCKKGAKVCFVIGDSAPYGIYVPVEKWLGDLAIEAGFYSYTFEKLRDRNIKWKNRKHRVPLHEGRLWVEG